MAPLATIIGIAIPVAAFIRSGKPTLPLAWVQQRGRGPNGATMTVIVENKTDRSVRINSLRRNRRGTKFWPAGLKDQITDELLVDREIAPDDRWSVDISIPLEASNSPTNERIKLSVSTMRWITRTRAITVPIIVPANK